MSEPEDEIKCWTIASGPRPAWMDKIRVAPWSVVACPKSWGEYSPEHQEKGWHLHVAIDDDLASVNVDAVDHAEGEDRALRLLLPMLEVLDIETLTEKQQATRTDAIAMLKERFGIPGPVRQFGSTESPP